MLSYCFNWRCKARTDACCIAPTLGRNTTVVRPLSFSQEFGLERLLQAGPESLKELLAVDAANWRRALAVWQLLGVAEPAALGLRNTRSLTLDWLAPDRLASLAALQQLLPWQPLPADAVQHCSGYVANYAPPRLMGRLLFLQQEGVLPLLVADKRTAKRQWQQQRGPAAGQAAEEPPFFSLPEALQLKDADFLALPASALEAQPGRQPGSSNSSNGTSVSTVAERCHAFMSQLPQLPAYQQLLAAGAAESQRLAALLPPELALAAAGDRSA